MKIALDYDGTYTQDPELWDSFILLCLSRGHEVKCVTMRHPHEPVEIGCDVVYTSRSAKSAHYVADVWIDDMPHFIFTDSR